MNPSQGRIPWETMIWRGIIWKTIFPTRICKTSDNDLAFASQYRILFPCSWYPATSEGRLVVSEYGRTGCIFCMFGTHYDGEPTRFQRLQRTHPKLWRYCMRDWEAEGWVCARYWNTLKSQKRITGFSETLWLNTVERLWVGKGGIMKFEFKGSQCVEG